jgi:hypothetical protein
VQQINTNPQPEKTKGLCSSTTQTHNLKNQKDLCTTAQHNLPTISKKAKEFVQQLNTTSPQSEKQKELVQEHSNTKP